MPIYNTQLTQYHAVISYCYVNFHALNVVLSSMMVEDQNGRFDIHCVVLSCRGEVVRGLLSSPRRKPRDADRSFVLIKRYETVYITSNHMVDIKASRLQAPPFCILEPGLPKYLWGEPVCHPGKAQLSTIKHLVGASSSLHRKQTLEFWKPHKVFKNKTLFGINERSVLLGYGLVRDPFTKAEGKEVKT